MIDEYNADRTGWARFSDDKRMRYRLARSLTGSPVIVRDSIVLGDRICTFLMLNPSTADAFALDPTVRRCVGFARDLDADVLQVVNLFALRSTDPDALYEPGDIGDGHLNDGEIIGACTGSVFVIAGWGVHGALRRGSGGIPRGRAVKEMLQDRLGFSPMHLGLTKAGHPKHPLYLKATTQPEAWA